jgi:hypothetical protein
MELPKIINALSVFVVKKLVGAIPEKSWHNMWNVIKRKYRERVSKI